MSARLSALALLSILVLASCGAEEPAAPQSPPTSPAPAPAAEPEQQPAPQASAAPPDLPQALVLALAQFVREGGKPVPGPARLEFLVRRGGRWDVEVVEDPESNVFHKAMVYPGEDGPVLLSLGGSRAIVKAWKPADGSLTATTLWEKDFGGKFSRMRDAEVADLFGDGRPSIAVATHDQGVVAVLRPGAGGFQVQEIDHEKDTFVHEIEVGDLDGDGTLEVYATPSEPNKLDGTPQPGKVVRYVPARGEGRQVVADLGDRHAKEILVDDVDGDGTDELYVSVEGQLSPGKELIHPVEIRRYDAGTDPTAGSVIAVIDDSLCRFLTAGDVDGDGKKELVAAAYSKGVWLLRPGDDPRAEWQAERIDADSAGFEHAALLADLDGDGTDELYVASDKHKEVRRYVWNGSFFDRETIYRRPDDRPIFTWNLMPVPVELVPEGS
jgi:hypothetical protein